MVAIPRHQTEQQRLADLLDTARAIKSLAVQTNTVGSVTAGDGTITIGGTASAPTVAATVGTTTGTVAGGADSRIVGAPQNNPAPAAQALAGWTFDPVAIQAGQAPVGGTLYLLGVPITVPTAVSVIGWGHTVAGVTPTAGQNWVGLYNTAGTLLGSAGVDASVTSTGLVSGTITAQTLPVGNYWVAMLFNAATLPQVARGSNSGASLVNAGETFTVATLRFATNGTGRTTLPATITPSANVASALPFWAVLA